MNRFVALSSAFLLSIFRLMAQTGPTTLAPGTAISMSNEPASPEMTIFAPDFAYPSDVIATARAFMEAKAPDKYPSEGGVRLLAAQEEVIATLSIDGQQINATVKGLLKMADLEPDSASRAMFLAYTAALCKEKAYLAKGFVDKPDPAAIDSWNRTAFKAAHDSLYRRAMEIAPDDALLINYKAALTEVDPSLNLLKTVPDFIVYHWGNGYYYSDEIKKYIEKIPQGTPLWYFIQVKLLGNGDERVDFIEKHLSDANVCYSILAALTNPGMSGKSLTRGEGYKVLEKYAEGNVPLWIRPTVDDIIRCHKLPNWNIYIPGKRYAGVPFGFHISSQRTDTLDCMLYRFEKLPREFTPNSLASALEKRQILITPDSGEKFQYDTVYVTLPGGQYYMETKFAGKTYSESFSVSPWVIVTCNNEPGKAFIQILDPITGKGVKDVKIQLTSESDSKAIRLVTDKEGIAFIHELYNSPIILTDPATGLKYDARFISIGLGIPQEERDNLILTIKTDLPVYRPGDTVKWEGVFRKNKETVENATTKFEISLPKDHNSVEKFTEFESQPSDVFGRIHGEFTIPRETPPGTGYIVSSQGTDLFRIAEYKLPEINIRNIKYAFIGDSVRVTGYVLNRADAPRPDTDVKISIFGSVDSVFTFDGKTDSHGKFDFTFPRLIACDTDKAEDYPDINFLDLGEKEFLFKYNSHSHYTVEASTADGYSASVSGSYPDFFDVNLIVDCQKVYDISKGIEFTIDYELYGKNKDAAVPMCHWGLLKIDSKKFPPHNTYPVLEGDAPCGAVVLSPEMLKDLKPGSYQLKVMPVGIKGYYYTNDILLYNVKSSELPVNTRVWTPDDKLVINEKGAAELLIGSAENGTNLWYTLFSENPSVSATVNSLKLKKGFHKVEFDVKDANYLAIWNVGDGITMNKRFSVPKKSDSDTLSLTLESFRDRSVSGAPEHWTFVTRRAGLPVSAALSVNVIDKRVLTLAPANYLWLSPIIANRSFYGYMHIIDNSFNKNIRYDGVRFSLSSELLKKVFPDWRYDFGEIDRISIYGARSFDSTKNAVTSSGTVRGLSIAYVKQEDASESLTKSADIADIEDLYDVVGYGTQKKSAGGVGDAENNGLINVVVREGDVFNALWEPMLTTGAETGAVDLDFMLPDQTTAWRLSATAWTTDLKNASLKKEFVASKPIYVVPNMPRFVRVGDRVDIVTAITNDTDSALSVSYDVTWGNSPLTGTVGIDARSTRFVTTVIPIEGRLALNDSLSLTFRATDGTYGDGERVTVPILPSSALIVESVPFYLNPEADEFGAKIAFTAGENDRNELHFTDNPMWIVVESLLPVLDGFDEKTCLPRHMAQAWYAAATARKIAEKHPAAAQVIDIEKARRIEKQALKDLTASQNPDGSFPWGTWSNDPSFSTTLSVLEWLDQDSGDPGLDRTMIDKALRYVDANVATSRAKLVTHLPYALVRSAYGKPYTLAGQSVINNTINDAVKNWKRFSLGDKCLAALLLSRNGYANVAREILRSVSQYGVKTPDRGIMFPNMPGVVGYSNMLEAFKAADSQNDIIDAVRQALVSLRRGYSWGSAPDAAYAVRAMVTTGSDWTVPAGSVSLKVDGHDIALPPSTSLRGAFAVDIDGDSLLLTRTPGTPAFGAIVSRRIVPLAAVEPFGNDRISITKTIYALGDKGERIPIERATLQPGMKVVVACRILADADMTDIIVNDSRSAAFEPVDQIGRYRRNENGTWYYVVSTSSSTDFYIERLPRGYTTVEYEAVVNNSGTFTTGVATVTSGEDADLTAHSDSRPLTISPRARIDKSSQGL